ncbi:MAG: LiaF transmembrane domain-containing protein [Bacteroidales bacterium]
MFFALLVIAAGVLFLFNSLDLLPYAVANVVLTWQMLLIVIGLFNIFSAQHKTTGIILLLIGGFFLLGKFYDIHVNFWQVFWPTLLIVIGVSILVAHNKKPKPNPETGELPPMEKDADIIDEVSVFSGSERTITSKNFRGGKITNVFGGSEINMVHSELSAGRNEIEVFYIFGGSSIIVPPDWDVQVDVTAIFGGFSDKRHKVRPVESDNTKRIFIKGLVIFGGGEIKSY